MATHSSIFAWRIPWTEEPSSLQSMSQKSRTWQKDATWAAWSSSSDVGYMFLEIQRILNSVRRLVEAEDGDRACWKCSLEPDWKYSCSLCNACQENTERGSWGQRKKWKVNQEVRETSPSLEKKKKKQEGWRTQATIYQNWKARTSLVVQWLRIHMSMQVTCIWSLVWEDLTCHSATMPLNHNYQAR